MSENKVVKFKKRKSINIGIIVFLILFLYIAINVYIYFTKEQLSIYEVHEGTTAIDNRITGLILRQEEIVKSRQAGYISYFQKDGARVSKNSAVYAVDDSGQVYGDIASGEIPITLTDENHSKVRRDVQAFQNNFSNNDFSYVYDFKEETESTVLDILNSTIISSEESLNAVSGSSYSLNTVKTAKSGIVSYYVDNFETVTPETVTSDMCKPDNYSRTSLRTTDILAQDSPIYKLITSEEWNIVLPLTEEQYKELADKEYVTFTVLEDDFEMTAKLTLSLRGSDYFAQLTMNKYLSDYLNDRYLDVELDFDSVEGLKIPVSSIVEKSFYLVPQEYFSMGADSSEEGLIQETYNETGDVTYTFVATDKYYEDDAYVYVDTQLFPSGTWIHSSTNSDRYQLSQMNKLTGVYNVNMGYAVFKRIDVLFQNEEYCIVAKDTTNGLSAYDHIALDGATAVDQAIIY